MSRRLTGGPLLLATHNAGKIAELTRRLAPLGVTTASAREHALPEPAETAPDFAGNAALKAAAAAGATGLPALADDSGLACCGLDGAPGVHSARWAGPAKDFATAMERIRDELVGRHGDLAGADRRAAFVCCLCLAWPDGHLEEAEGRIEGELVFPPRGRGGFGYDPIFVPEGGTRSFAEMAPAEKDRQSHRRRALDALLARCAPPAR